MIELVSTATSKKNKSCFWLSRDKEDIIISLEEKPVELEEPGKLIKIYGCDHSTGYFPETSPHSLDAVTPIEITKIEYRVL